jgi:predicted RNase H-like nuclease (RuvC/YqgF family)
MRDSVEFLRSKATEYAGEYNPEPSKIFKAAAKEIARLRRRLAEATQEIERLRRNDGEAEAMRWSRKVHGIPEGT